MGQWILENVLYLLLAVATIFGYFWISQFKERLRIKEWMALILSIVHTLVGVLCVKLFAFLESGESGGMSLYGAIFFLPVIYFAFAKLTKRKVSDVFDIFTICTIVTLFCARINCIYAGCCVGSEIPGLDGIRWPTREAELIFYIVLYILLRKKVNNPKFSGKIYPIYMMAYGAFRFVVEFFRESHFILGFIHISHIWSLVAVAVGAMIYIGLSKKSSQKSRVQKQSNIFSDHKIGRRKQ